MPTHQFEAASYADLKHGDHIQIPLTYHGTHTGWWWHILTVDHIEWLRDDHTALMIRLTEPLPCGDRFALITTRNMIETGVRRAIRTDSLTPGQRRLLNSWNTARHGWARFQDSNRRAALRMARHTPMEPDMPRYEVRTIDADPTSGPVDYWKAPQAPVYYVHDTDRDRPVFGSYHDKNEADRECADLNRNHGS